MAWVMEHVWDAEGRAADHPDDRGGLTNRYGVSEGTALRYGYESPLDVDREGAELIFESDVWRPHRLEGIDSKYLCHEVADTAWNGGFAAGPKAIQRASNVVRRQAIHRSSVVARAVRDPLRIDGRIGPITIEAVNELTAKYEKHLYHWANFFQLERFLAIADGDPSQDAFIAGWGMRGVRFREMLP